MREIQQALCRHTRGVAEASSFCRTLSCYTDVFNTELSTTCSTLGQRICQALQPAVSDVVHTAVDTPVSGLPSGYDVTKVPVPTSCNPSDCRAAQGGAGGKSVVAAVVFAVGALLL